jgi:hypothetical protein
VFISRSRAKVNGTWKSATVKYAVCPGLLHGARPPLNREARTRTRASRFQNANCDLNLLPRALLRSSVSRLVGHTPRWSFAFRLLCHVWISIFRRIHPRNARSCFSFCAAAKQAGSGKREARGADRLSIAVALETAAEFRAALPSPAALLRAPVRFLRPSAVDLPTTTLFPLFQ